MKLYRLDYSCYARKAEMVMDLLGLRQRERSPRSATRRVRAASGAAVASSAFPSYRLTTARQTVSNCSTRSCSGATRLLRPSISIPTT
jgi:hypothetical protein